VPVGVAVLLMRRNLALLVDQAAPADIRERLRQAVAAEPWVAEVAELTAVYIAVEAPRSSGRPDRLMVRRGSPGRTRAMSLVECRPVVDHAG
jgi:hypothetical protein